MGHFGGSSLILGLKISSPGSKNDPEESNENPKGSHVVRPGGLRGAHQIRRLLSGRNGRDTYCGSVVRISLKKGQILRVFLRGFRLSGGPASTADP